MDPVQVIVSALSMGAAAAIKDTAEQTIKDAYHGLKSYIRSRYREVDLRSLERMPESQPKKLSVAEDLIHAGADSDTELIEKAKTLIELVDEKQPSLAVTVGVDLDGISAEYFRARNVISKGPQSTGIRAKDSEFQGGFEVENLEVNSEQRRPKDDRQ